jgi:predicted GIY-YIG superfamily endonuclease
MAGHFPLMNNFMFYVYIIKSVSSQAQVYVGYTNDLEQRMADHNSGKSIHTSKYLPWELVTYLVFKNEDKAIKFEKFLKTGSGSVFKNKRLL